jgi:hypothetical protein
MSQRIEGGVLGAQPGWSVANRSGVWSPTQVFNARAQNTWSSHKAFRYWRMDGWASTTLNGDTLDLSEIRFWAGATQLQGISVSASFVPTGGTISLLANEDTSTNSRVYRSSWASLRPTAWMEFDFASPVVLTDMQIFSLYTQPRFPASFFLSKSATAGSGFVTHGTVTVGTSFTSLGSNVYSSAKVAV